MKSCRKIVLVTCQCIRLEKEKSTALCNTKIETKVKMRSGELDELASLIMYTIW